MEGLALLEEHNTLCLFKRIHQPVQRHSSGVINTDASFAGAATWKVRLNLPIMQSDPAGAPIHYQIPACHQAACWIRAPVQALHLHRLCYEATPPSKRPELIYTFATLFEMREAGPTSEHCILDRQKNGTKLSR